MEMISWIKRILIFLGIAFAGHTIIYGQNKLVEEYMKEAGDFAVIYSGELETIYNPFIYVNDPYYVSQDYTKGELVYRGNAYANLQMRLDLYKGHLLLLTPKTNLGIIVNPEHVNEVRMHGKVQIYHKPPPGTGLKTGYYSLLHNGQKLKLLGRQNVTLEPVHETAKERFASVYRYYLVRDGIYYPVRNKQSFTKLFPDYKKQINRYAKQNMLNFKREREGSLTKLAQFCEEMNQSR